MGSISDTNEEEQSISILRITDLHGRQRDIHTGNVMEEGQEGPNSIFYVPGMPSETQPDYRLYVKGDEMIPFSKWMKKMRDAGFEGSRILFGVTPRPQDVRRVPKAPPAENEVNEGGVAMAVARFYRTKCNYCWAIVNESERETGFDMSEIEGAVKRGCSTCRVICAGIRNFADMIFPRFNPEQV